MTEATLPSATVEAAPGHPAWRRPAAFVTIDRGTATSAGAIVGRVERRWRLLTSTAVPAAADSDELLALLLDRVRAEDPALASQVGLATSDADLPRLEARGAPCLSAVVLAATEATRKRLERDAAAAGWRTAGASAERDDPLDATRLATRPDVATLVVGTGDPPVSDERDLLGELVALAVAIAERRPGLPVVLVGAAAAQATAFPARTEVVAVPRPHGEPTGDLRAILAGRRAGPGDGRQSLAAVTGTLSGVLGLRIELLEIGMSGALRVRAEPAAEPAGTATLAAVEVPDAALGVADDDAALDRVEGWVTLGLDRARLRDRLAELRLAPWIDLDAEGALLRAAALRASLERLVEATDGELGGPAPDLVVLAGGAWSSVPAPAALLVLADGLRRPGIVQAAIDPARLLAPLGTISDPEERARVVGDLLGDLLVPLGTLVLPRGVRGGRAAGRLRLTSDGPLVDMELAAGGLALVDLPPGQGGEAELTFRSAVDVGVRGRRFAVRATGGLAGLVVDLRDSPLRLPDRPDERRELLSRWERVLWQERDG